MYFMVNADESEPGTFKDRWIMDYDPHAMIEGSIIAAYAVRAGLCFIYIRGEFGWLVDRVQAAVDEAYRAGYLGPRHPRLRLLPRDDRAQGGRRLHLRRGDRPHQLDRGAQGAAEHQAAVPGGAGLPQAADHRQQRRNGGGGAADHPRRGGRLPAVRHREVARHQALERERSGASARASTRSRSGCRSASFSRRTSAAWPTARSSRRSSWAARRCRS